MEVTDNSEAMGFMSRHFVALLCECELTEADGTKKRGVNVFSGFLLQLHGHGFWVTAGHCLKDELDEPLKAGTLKILGGSYLDHFGHEPKFVDGVPYTYEMGDSFYIEDPENGLDFALIRLDSLKVQAFLANDLIFISRKNWEHQPKLHYDSYLMLGLIGQPRLELQGGKTILHTEQAMITVNKITPDDIGELPHDMSEPPSEDWFLGRIPKDEKIPSIQRMSGGPIYGFRNGTDGQLMYHVVALQSRWWTKSRNIFGCPLTLFGEWCHDVLSDVLAIDDVPSE